MGDVLSFEHAPTLDRASLSKASFRCVEGPVNSGKSVWSLSEVLGKAMTMPRCNDGIRRSKFLVVRDSYPNLESSTIPTWLQWVKEDIYGKLTGSEPKVHHLNFMDVECTIVFRAFSLDNLEKAIKDLRSTEWTGAWINEGQFMPLALVKEIYSRTGRFPAKKDCPKYDRRKWAVMDMNAPAFKNFWGYLMRGKEPMPKDWTAEQRYEYMMPEDWEFLEQPAAVLEIRDEKGGFIRFDVNPEAENLFWTGEDSIKQEMSGRSYNDVRRDLMNKVVPMTKGFPRYTNFQTRLHVGKNLKPDPNYPIIAGYDPGVHGCVHLMQKIEDRWIVYHSILADGKGASNLADKVLDVLNTKFPFWVETGFIGWGDPYGDVRFGAGRDSDRQEDTAFEIFKAKGMPFKSPSPKDNPSMRREIGKNVLVTLSDTGGPRLLIDENDAAPLIAAYDGGCTMKSQQTKDGMRVEELVDKKNPLADVMEAAEYAFWGGGEKANVVTPMGHEPPKPTRYTGRAKSKGALFSNRKRRAG
jgi:hypothetical protein